MSSSSLSSPVTCYVDEKEDATLRDAGQPGQHLENSINRKNMSEINVTVKIQTGKTLTIVLGPDDRLMVEKLQDLPPADPPAAWSKSHAQGA